MTSEKVSREVSPASHAAEVTVSDTTVYDPPGRSLYVGVTGNVVVRMAGTGAILPFMNVQGGSILPIAVDQVRSTNTTASSINILY